MLVSGVVLSILNVGGASGSRVFREGEATAGTLMDESASSPTLRLFPGVVAAEGPADGVASKEVILLKMPLLLICA